MQIKFISTKFPSLGFWLLYSFFILAYVIYFMLFGDVSLCDSGDNINEFVDRTVTVERDNSNTEGGNVGGYPVINPVINRSILFRFKCKLVWYVKGKKSGDYNSYNDFKNSWNSGVEQDSLWKIIKYDLRKTRFNISKDRSKSLEQTDKLMKDIRESRNNKYIIDQERRNLFNKGKK